jgi:hypothetical protein
LNDGDLTIRKALFKDKTKIDMQVRHNIAQFGNTSK